MVVGRMICRLVLGLGLVVATIGPSAAQPVSRDELGRLLSGIVGTGEDAIENILETQVGFTPDSAALLVSFAADVYANADFQNYLLTRIEEYDRAAVLQMLDDLAATARAEAYRFGSLRMPPSGLDAFVNHIRDILVWLSATDPALCAALARNPVAVLQNSDIEFQYFARISPQELRAVLRSQRVAILAEASETPPYQAFSRAELAAGRLALAEAVDEVTTLPPPGGVCTALSICRPPPTEDEARCTSSLTRYTVIDTLPEPQRTWAIAAFIIDL